MRTVLVNPRYAGRAVYCGEATGKAGQWEAIVDEPTFDRVQQMLTDPRRITNRVGTDRRHLGSGLYLCGVCGGPDTEAPKTLSARCRTRTDRPARSATSAWFAPPRCAPPGWQRRRPIRAVGDEPDRSPWRRTLRRALVEGWWLPASLLNVDSLRVTCHGASKATFDVGGPDDTGDSDA